MKIALIAHDKKKKDMIELAKKYQNLLNRHELIATGTTGTLLTKETGLPIACYLSGPLGGDQQIGGEIAQGQVGLVIFLRDPMTPQPHEPDISALIRICDVHNIPVATNLGTASLLLSGLNDKLTKC
ncbi:methylglyoxal synthase [Desulforamulus aquiferis]|uniref:Methylglyoxal synthase n=1 Tax=Desulforamulus aquiferis TaxID=1397668 RepID=A0AAW7Z7I3_9FIRM|nr:methylglyoxal synthase [Desulforamulus aquiferis]MDO7785750.1 methylglyoxal synthase [Desulforamulus aquiferis]